MNARTKRKPRTFDEKLDHLMKRGSGWEEQCPERGRWYFRKKRFLAVVHWTTHSIQVQKLVKQLR